MLATTPGRRFPEENCLLASLPDDEYARLIANYSFRHHMKPGITGWAQISGLRGATPTVDLMEQRKHLSMDGLQEIAAVASQINRQKPLLFSESSETARQALVSSE